MSIQFNHDGKYTIPKDGSYGLPFLRKGDVIGLNQPPYTEPEEAYTEPEEVPTSIFRNKLFIPLVIVISLPIFPFIVKGLRFYIEWSEYIITN